jgi:hypothetical protein
MVRGARRTAIALVLSVVVMMPLSARPARAINWEPVIVAGINAVATALTAGNTVDAIKQATTQILAAVNGAKSEILAGIETIAVAQTRACANHAVIEFIDIERMTPDNMQRFAQDATGCVTSITSLLPTITGKAQIDQLGFALNVVAPIALNARARTGLTTSALEANVHTAETQLVSALTPDTCSSSSPSFDPELPLPHRGDPVDYLIICDAYNGDFGSHTVTLPWPTSPSDADWNIAANDALRKTSKAIAINVLPLFRF